MALPGGKVLEYCGLRYLAARKLTLCVGTPLAVHKLAQVTFGKKGIFVQCPHFRATSGIASRVELGPEVGPPYHLKLDEHGKVTSHLVKLSHHVDGAVHFSQAGRVRTEIRRRSFRLDRSIGTVFHLSAFWLSDFEVRKSGKLDSDRAYIQFRSMGSHGFAVQFEGEWRRKKAMVANFDPPGGHAGPETRLIHRRTGREVQAFFVGTPLGAPFQDHVLVLSCMEIPIPDTVKKPLFVLLGGWDPHEVPAGGDVRQTGCLVALYPVESTEELRERLGSIDLQPRTTASG